MTIAGEERRLLELTDREPIPPNVRCKDCGSRSLYRHGIVRGRQRYKCRDCGITFMEGTALARMRFPSEAVGAALGLFYGGASLDSVGRNIGQIYGVQPDGSNVYRWVVRFTRVALKLTQNVQPRAGAIWVADETVLKIAGQNQWFWDCIDDKTRYLLASHISESRFTRDAETLMGRALRVAGKPPKVIVTDKLRSYLDGIERVFGADSKHVQSGPFVRDRKGDSIRAIERFHGSLKDRTKVMRGMQNHETARLVTQGWLFHYNFLRPHEGLGGRRTPAQAAGLKPRFTTWTDVVLMDTRRR